MPEFDDLFDDLDDNASGSDLVKSLRAALKAEKKARKDEQERLAALLKKDRANSLADVLKEKGVSPKAAALYPADADTSADAVEAWLGEFGDLFGIEKNESTANEATQNAASRLTGATANAPAATQVLDLDGLAAAIAAATTPEELAAAYARAGLPVGD